MKKRKKYQKNTQLKKLLKREQNNLNSKSNQKLKKKITQFGKNANVTKTEEYVEVSVTYEVIENIGMQEKIEEIKDQTEETQ